MQPVFDELPCVYFAASGKGIITEVNATLCDYLGYTSAELIGSKLEQVFSLSTRIFQQTHFYPLLQLKGHAEEIYITLKCKDETEVPILVNAVRKETEDGLLFIYAGIGLNKRKKFEDEIIAAKKAAEKALNENIALKAAQMELQTHAEQLDRQITLVNKQNIELKQFNHLTTHSLQEPLRKMLFYSSQVLDSKDANKVISGAQKINKAAADLSEKIKGLQHYVRLTNEEMEMEEVDLIPIIHLVKNQTESEQQGLKILLETDSIPLFHANKNQMLFLMKEVITNAVKFRKPDCDIHVKVEASKLLLNNFRQLTGKYKYSEFVKVEIQDNGIGFDGTYQDQAFELFRKLHPEGGRGIGLALCKKIVDNHNGFISLDSQKNRGTKVILLLPFRQEEKAH